jgi:hypothetical protein
MYYEREFEFQVASHQRAAGDPIRSACSLAAKHPPQASNFSVAITPRTLPKLGHSSPFTIHKSRAASHGFLIVTPRLEFPATVTKQSPSRISNRYKIAVFTSGFPAPARNRQEPPRPEFLIVNLELEFFLNIAKSMKYKFLIANKGGFSVCCAGSRSRNPESLFECRNLSSENRSAILTRRPKLRIGVPRMTPVKVKSLLCYGGSHFQLCKMLTNRPSVILGEN